MWALSPRSLRDPLWTKRLTIKFHKNRKFNSDLSNNSSRNALYLKVSFSVNFKIQFGQGISVRYIILHFIYISTHLNNSDTNCLLDRILLEKLTVVNLITFLDFTKPVFTTPAQTLLIQNHISPLHILISYYYNGHFNVDLVLGLYTMW
jgi:hypothetical protein